MAHYFNRQEKEDRIVEAKLKKEVPNFIEVTTKTRVIESRATTTRRPARRNPAHITRESQSFDDLAKAQKERTGTPEDQAIVDAYVCARRIRESSAAEEGEQAFVRKPAISEDVLLYEMFYKEGCKWTVMTMRQLKKRLSNSGHNASVEELALCVHELIRDKVINRADITVSGSKYVLRAPLLKGLECHE